VFSNPTCVEQAYNSITEEQIREAQDYYRSNPPVRSFHNRTLEDLNSGSVTTESDLVNVLINHLIRPDQARLLSSLGIDLFDLITGKYDDSAAPFVEEMFREWNAVIGYEYFSRGKNHTALLTR